MPRWWVIVLRGLLSIAFGVLAFLWPEMTLAALVLLFGAYALVDGLFALGDALMVGRHGGRWWPLVLEGVLGIGAGIAAFVVPGLTAITLLFLIAAWAILTGIAEIVLAIRLRNRISGEWALILAGVLSVLFGILLVVFPAAGALAVIWMIASYAILFGILLIVVGLRVRGWQAGQPLAPSPA